MEIIARIRTDFSDKFGIPRQANRVPGLVGKIVFEEKYSDENALRGLEDFSHIWLIWEFSKNVGHKYSPTVRPPRLGGETRVGVFATRSPFRPNPIGLSCVRLDGIGHENGRSVLYVAGVDMLDGTPIYDIKPYIPYADCHPDATGGFTEDISHRLVVKDDDKLMEIMPDEIRNTLIEVLSEDPRPSYQNDPNREYGMDFAGYNIHFRVDDKTLMITDIKQ